MLSLTRAIIYLQGVSGFRSRRFLQLDPGSETQIIMISFMIYLSVVDEGSVSSDAEYSDNDDDDGYDEYYSFNDEEENRLLFQVIYT